MPESQFGPAQYLAATLDELVALARHLRATPADIQSRLTRLEGLTKLLDYFSTPHYGITDPIDTWPIAVTTHCAHADCARTWRDADACLLNFAQRGEPPIWLCRDHHPPLSDGGVRPPGWSRDIAALAAEEAARAAVFAKIDRATELQLINSRAGG